MRHATDGEDSNRAALAAQIDDRVAGLMEMGETGESVAATFSKARWHDIGSEGARGFVGSVPFGVASRLLDTLPGIGDTVVAGMNALPGLRHAPDTFKAGAAAGMVSGAIDHVGSQALGPAMTDTQWLAAPHAALEGAMPEAKARAEAGMLRAVGQSAASIQTFTARNVVRGVVGPTMTALGHAAAAAETDSWLAAIGSPLAGAGFNVGNRHFAERDHRVGPEYLLGRTDWKTQYQALKAATWTGAAANGAGRVAKALVNTVEATLSAPQTLLSSTSLAMNVGALGAGLGAVTMATTGAGELARHAGAGEAGVSAARHAARTVTSAGVFASWTTAAIVTQPAVDAARGASAAIGNLVHKGVSTAVNAGGDAIGKGAQVIGEQAEAGANYLGPRLSTARDTLLRRRTNATPQNVEDGESHEMPVVPE
ncbi:MULTISPECIES: hypothetical protein [Pandoraea]|uniref:hypothetical protein n=1 Tax=Pandoraea TaxID=93217 RepID=UPI001F5CF489|nr:MULTISPECIES: hypothetical protein [Pandoraea]MCI3208741.1 hypothetical protein [Pandoraea sp. LA3]MDN4586770.1 hypothetical protein [Pandoraea capi]